jgi:uncharacterized protein YraI
MKRILCSIAGLLLSAPLLASAADGWVVADISLQAGPDTGYPSIMMLEAGEPVSIQGCIAGWSWCDVIADEERGWVPGTFLQEEYRGRPVILIDYGARIGVPLVSFSIGTYWEHHYHNRPFYAQRQRWESRSIHPHAPPRPSHIVATAPRSGGTHHEHSMTQQQERTATQERTTTKPRVHNTETQALTQEQRDRRRARTQDPQAVEQRHARAEPQPPKPTDTAPQMVPQERPVAQKPEPPQRAEHQVARNDKPRDQHQAKQQEPKPKDELNKPNRKHGKDNNDDDNGGGRR